MLMVNHILLMTIYNLLMLKIFKASFYL